VELAREAQQRMRWRHLGQAIGAMLEEPAMRFTRRQAALRVGRDFRNDGRGIQGVPGVCGGRVRIWHGVGFEQEQPALTG
jgi:hypothetical protein